MKVKIISLESICIFEMQQEQMFLYYTEYTVCNRYITKHKKINTKYSLYFFSTLRLHRVTDVALRGIYICILFTAYFDVFIFTWSKRSAKNTVLRTNQNSKWVQNFRKRYSLMTLMTNSSQCNIPQCKYPSFILCWTHIFFGNKTSLNQPTAEKNCVSSVLMFVQIETLNHAPTTPTHINKFMCLMEKR